MDHGSKSNWIDRCVIAVAVTAVLYSTSLYSYLLFHSLIEIITISIAFTLFVITWNTKSYLTSGCLRLLGMGYGLIAVIDLFHTLAYKGMNIFPNSNANLATQFWISARYLQAAILLLAMNFISRRLYNSIALFTLTTSVGTIAGLIFSGNFPDCYIDDVGLTPFKIESEYLISIAMTLSLYLLYISRNHFNASVFLTLFGSIACTIISELSFTAYVGVYGFANLLGHFLKLAAFYLLYRAILVTGLREPFALIFKQLHDAKSGLEDLVRERTAELKLAQQDLRAILDNVPAMIGYWDKNLLNRFGNRAYLDWFGVDPKQMPGLHVRDVLGDAIYKANLPYINAVLKGEPQAFERTHTKSAVHDTRHSQTYYIPDIQDGEVKGFYVLVTDVTNIKIAENAAQEASRAKSNFLAMMSHEIRTPITGVLGMADLLRQTSLNAEQAEYLQIMATSAKTLLNILNDILDFSRIEAGKMPIKSAPFSIQQFASETIALHRPSANDKGIALNFAIEGGVPEILIGAPDRLGQILNNLISNAIKFTDKGSVSLNFRTTSLADDLVCLLVEVADTGIGIAEKDFDRLFKLFSQVDSSSKRRHGGTGLGLIITRRLVEAMGSEIFFESRLGEGSRFWFSVNLNCCHGEASESVGDSTPKPNIAPMVRPLSILLAEDNPVNQRLVKSMLGKLGYKVDVAGNGRVAVELASIHEYDAVLMDMQMPEMDGEEATRVIRSMPPPKCLLPILALTADAMIEHRERYLEAGVNDLVTKPIDWQILSRTLASHTAQHTSNAQVLKTSDTVKCMPASSFTKVSAG